MATEFRVRWRREGRATKTVLRQTAQGAYRKANAILALEEVKPDTTYADMPDLAAPPVVEVREVGEWRVAERQPAEPSEAAVERMREWAPARAPAGVNASDPYDDGIPF